MFACVVEKNKLCRCVWSVWRFVLCPLCMLRNWLREKKTKNPKNKKESKTQKKLTDCWYWLMRLLCEMMFDVSIVLYCLLSGCVCIVVCVYCVVCSLFASPLGSLYFVGVGRCCWIDWLIADCYMLWCCHTPGSSIYSICFFTCMPLYYFTAG